MILSKLAHHIRRGSLLHVAKTKVRHLTVGNRAAGDSYYGERAVQYEANRVGKPYWDDQQAIAEALVDQFPDGSDVLDVPFGTGRFAEVYNRKTMRVSGLDISDEMIESARRERGDAIAEYDLRVGDARALPWDDESFDLVMCFRFLSEIVSLADARLILAEIARVSRDAAVLDLGIRDPSAPPLRRPPRETERSGVALTREQVGAMLETAGFEIESCTRQYASGDGHRYAVVCRKTKSQA